MSEFDQFWAVYPRKVCKKAARAAFEKAVRIVAFECILQGARDYAEEVADYVPKYIAHPATWLNAERWDDERETSHVDQTKYRKPTPEEARIYRQENPFLDRDPEWIPKDWGKLRIVS